MKIRFLPLAAGVALCIQANSQTIPLTPSTQETVYTNTGFDYGLVSVNVGYSRYFSQYKIAPFVELTQNPSIPGFKNFRVGLGAKTWVGSYRSFIVNSSASAEWVKSTNKGGNYNSFGGIVEVNPGFMLKKRVAIGLNLYYNPIFSTHIKHTALFRDGYYADVKDGWYSSTATNRRIGLYLSALVGKQKSWEIGLKGGYQTSGEYDQLLPNNYLLIGINKRLK